MKQKRGLTTFAGFLLLALGLVSLVLSLVGVQLSFLRWIDIPGPLFGFVIRLLLIIGGFVIIYLSQTDFEGKNPM
ncbi:MAG: hypothetical protein R3350_08270 [Saprospiraceae bacterium]|nr:hypothetical protein [Saprospiraceae bacterium]